MAVKTCLFAHSHRVGEIEHMVERELFGLCHHKCHARLGEVSDKIARGDVDSIGARV
jgi:hypothetical protein